MSKKFTFLVLALIVVFSVSLMAEPVANPVMPITNSKVKTSLSRSNVQFIDSISDINYRSFLPQSFDRIFAAPGGKYFIYVGRGTGTASYYGTFGYFSTDFGATWSQTPATGPVLKPTSDSIWQRCYTSLALGSSNVGYAPYTIAAVRTGGTQLGDTIMFAADLSGLGAGDWQSTPAAVNDSNSYRYAGNVAVMNDADVFVAMFDLYGVYEISHSGDYGTTWSETATLDANYFAPLLADHGPYDSLSWSGVDMPKILVDGNNLVFISDVSVDAWTGDSSSTITALCWATSSDSGKTWTNPQWVDPNILPTGYAANGGLNWGSWDAEITTNGKVVASGVYFPPDTLKSAKMFGHVYDGTNWTTTQIGPPDDTVNSAWTGLFNGDYAITQQGKVAFDNSGNAYIYWEDICKVDTVNDTARTHWGVAEAKFDGSSWKPAVFVDTLPDFYNYFTGASNVDDNGNILMGVVPGSAPNDTLYLFTEPAVAGIATKVNKTIKTMNLAQNMPNPVRGNTTINYSITKSGHVTLNVYDMSGKLVKTLVNGNVNAGTHSVVWNRTDNRSNKVAGGVYFYKMNANNETLTKKMIVVK